MIVNRRRFLKSIALAGGLPSLLGLFPASFASSDYEGKFLVTVQLKGGWDVSSFCDPKENVAGEKEINHWARTDQIQKVGDIPFAPYGNNQHFFEKHYSKILVVNGVDTQTNAHQTGEVHSWTGRIATGFPSLGALVAAVLAPELPMSHVNFGGIGNTEGIIRSTQIGQPNAIRDISFPNNPTFRPETRYLPPTDWERIQNAHAKNAGMLASAQGVIAGDLLNRQYYREAMAKAGGIQAFGSLIPTSDEFSAMGANTNLKISALVTLLAFKSGVSITSDLSKGGFDTHEFHDKEHEPSLAEAIDGIDYLWDQAEELGLADRLLVVVSSDFSRTPYYNSGEGKDHWPIGSYLIMEKNASYTNRVIGETDEGQNAFPVNPNTLERDNFNGVILKPAHIHNAIRKYMGIDGSALAKRFPFNVDEEVAIFG